MKINDMVRYDILTPLQIKGNVFVMHLEP